MGTRRVRNRNEAEERHRKPLVRAELEKSGACEDRGLGECLSLRGVVMFVSMFLDPYFLGSFRACTFSFLDL